MAIELHLYVVSGRIINTLLRNTQLDDITQHCLSVIMFRFPGGVKDFDSPKSQHWLRGPPLSFSMSNGGSFTKGKPAGAWSSILTLINALWRVQGQRDFTYSIPCIIINLLQFEQTNAHNFIQVTTTLQHTRRYMFRTLLVHHQGAQNCVHSLVRIAITSLHFTSLNKTVTTDGL